MGSVHAPTLPPARTRPLRAAPPEAVLTAGRRAMLAVGSGVALYAGHPPLDWEWAALVALAPLIALARDVSAGERPVRSGAGWGFVAGLVLFGALVGWVHHVDWLAVVLLVTIQAAFIATYVGGLAWLGPRRAWPLVAALWWVGVEALRGAVPFGGFAWGILGYTQHDGPFLLVARTLGVLGISLLLAGIAAAAEEAVHRSARRRSRPGAPVLAACAIAAAGFGLTHVPPPTPTGETVDVAAVQGYDVERSTGRSLPRALRIADGHVAATEALAASPAGPPELLVWPENALDSEPAAVPELAAMLGDALAAVDGTPIVSGVITDGPRPGTWQNTLAVFDGDVSQPRDVYVKRQPVPFGEYIPFRSLVGWYPPIQRMRPTDAVPGTETGVLDAGVDGVRIGAVICFESVFPRLVHSQVREGANLLVVATNNSSFGRTAMSDQHLAFSSLRAVETGRWLVHAALTGKSALVAPDGGVSQETGLFEQALIREDVPLIDGRTLATVVGDGVGWTALVLALGAFALSARGRPPRRRAPAAARS